MATAAFKSSTKRTPFVAPAAAEDAGSSNRAAAAHRRSRSLSRHTGRFPHPPSDPDELEPQNRSSGSKGWDPEFGDISLDDLADEFFRREPYEEEEEARSETGRPCYRRGASAGYRAETDSSRRRGRSASRQRGPAEAESKSSLESNGESKGVSSGRLRRQRSVSAAPRRRGGSEAMVKMEPTLTNKGDVSHSRNITAIQDIAEIRRDYSTKLKLSEKRKQDLLAKLAVEEQRGQELTHIVSKLLPTSKQTAVVERSSKTKGMQRRNDRTAMSESFTEEAEKIFEDFLSSIEDTDLSSFDGERSETSSTLGGSTKFVYPTRHNSAADIYENLSNAASEPVLKDGVALPWLQWETKFPSPKSNMGVQVASSKNLLDISQENSIVHSNSNHLTSSRGSWSPDANFGCHAVSRDLTSCKSGSRDMITCKVEVESHSSAAITIGVAKRSFDMDEYLHLHRQEDVLFETFRQRQRIDSGGLIICGKIF